MSTQPKALALACMFEEPHAYAPEILEAAAELRRLHALNAQMLEALEAYIGADRQDQYAVVGYDVDGHPVSAPGMARIKARAAIKAAKGQA